VLKEVLSTKNGKRTQYQMMSDKQKRKRLEEAKEDIFNLTNGFNLL
jgi:hypothetical protein